jgi:hypothetical protein
MLSHIRANGLRASVFSVPSVTLWKNFNELKAVAAMLKDKIVFVIPDADWFTNPAVDMQALLVRSALRRLDIETYIAAPSVDFFEQWGEKGVDDFLGQSPDISMGIESPGFVNFLRERYPDLVDDDGVVRLRMDTWPGGSLDDLVIRGREAPKATLDRLGRLRIDRQMRAHRALEGLSLHADKHGRHDRSLHRLASLMDIRGRVPERTITTLGDLQTGDAITVHGSLKLKTTNWNGVKVTDFAERPTIEVAEPFRAVEHDLLAPDFWQRRT